MFVWFGWFVVCHRQEEGVRELNELTRMLGCEISTDYADYTDYVVWGQGDKMFVWFVVYHRRVEFWVSNATRYPRHVVEFAVKQRYALTHPTPRGGVSGKQTHSVCDRNSISKPQSGLRHLRRFV
jgi:hypothetical protein